MSTRNLVLSEDEAFIIYFAVEKDYSGNKKPGLHWNLAESMYQILYSIARDEPRLIEQFERLPRPKRCPAREFPNLPTGKRCGLREHSKRIEHYDLRTKTHFPEVTK